jgi:hypothetical protein
MDKADRIVDEVKRVVKLWHQSFIQPTIRSLLTPLNDALKHDPSCIGLGKVSEVRPAFRGSIMVG